MNFSKAPADRLYGTSLQGFFRAPFDKIVKAFGQPHDDGDGYKTDAHWVLMFDDGTIATIYNYKDGRNYCGPDGLAVEEITDWHIGGTSRRAYDLVREAFGAAM